MSVANIILLLVSADFMASKLLRESEMQRALERHKAGTAHVIPIILRPVDWEETIIGTLQALPTDGKPITRWDNQDQAFLDVVRGIREVISTLIPKQILSPRETSILYPEQIDQEEASRHHAEEAERIRRMEEERQRRAEEEQVRKAEEARALTPGDAPRPEFLPPDQRERDIARVLSQVKTFASRYIQHRGMSNKRVLFTLILALLVTFSGVGIYYSKFGTRKPPIIPITPTLSPAQSTLTVTGTSATPTMTPISTIPHLKQSYNGESNCPVGFLYMQLVINSQDQQGHFTATASFGGGVYAYWTGTITADGSITAKTNRPNDYTGTFRGTIDPEGRIDGIETYSNESAIYHDMLTPIQGRF